MGNGLDWCMEESPKRKWSDGEREAAVISFSTLVIASAVLGLLVYETTVPFCRGAPCPARESLSVISTTVNSPTNVTLRIINSGSVAVSLASYYVKDAYGQTYANSIWAGPNTSPNTTLSLNLLLDGQRFSVPHGSRYALSVVPRRTSHDTFTST